MYLRYQYSKVQAKDLTAKHHNDQIGSLNKLLTFLGSSKKSRIYQLWICRTIKERSRKVTARFAD
jgi:hypothetical protein